MYSVLETFSITDTQKFGETAINDGFGPEERRRNLITHLRRREGKVINDRVSLVRENLRDRLAGLFRRVAQPHQVVIDAQTVYVIVHLLGLPLHRQVEKLLDPFCLKKPIRKQRSIEYNAIEYSSVGSFPDTELLTR